jgi:hypothetical protein
VEEAELHAIEETLAGLKAGAEERAKHIQPGQCPGCGSYRLDGRTPLLHEHGCPWKADAPLFYLPDGAPV